MKLHFSPDEQSNPLRPWSAETDDGDYDASGATPLEAAMALGDTLRNSLKEVGL